MMIQNDLIQIKVSTRFKNMVKKVADARGLPLSTYIKFILTEQLKDDPVWNTLEEKEEQESYIEGFVKEMKKTSKPVSKKKSKKIISKL